MIEQLTKYDEPKGQKVQFVKVKKINVSGSVISSDRIPDKGEFSVSNCQFDVKFINLYSIQCPVRLFSS